MSTSAPQWENLPITKLTVDPEVQRSLDKARVDRIAKAYQPSAIGAIVVSRREDGTYHIIDGQHRVHATIAAGLGDNDIACLVYQELSKPDEAAMFRWLNNSRAVSAIDKFRVRVVAEDEATVTLNSILDTHGWRVGSGKDDGYFGAVAALEAVYRGKLNGEGDTATVCNTLINVITRAWGHNTDGVRAEIISGLGAVLLRYNNHVDLVKLTSELSQIEGGPLRLVGRAKGLRDLRKGRVSDALAEIVVEMLNKSRRTNRLPDWRSSAS